MPRSSAATDAESFLRPPGQSASRINEGLRLAENRVRMLTLSTELSLHSRHGVDIFAREIAKAPADLKDLFGGVEFETYQRRAHQ